MESKDKVNVNGRIPPLPYPPGHTGIVVRFVFLIIDTFPFSLFHYRQWL